MRQIQTSSFAKLFGVSQHHSIGFDERFVYITNKSGAKKSIPIESISDFYRSQGLIWDDFTIVLDDASQEVIDGIVSSQSEAFEVSFDVEYAKSYYAFHFNRFIPIFNLFPKKDQYWKKAHFKSLCLLAKEQIEKFAYRKIEPSDKERDLFEIIIKLSKTDWSIQRAHNEQFLKTELKLYENYFGKVEKKRLTQKQREAVILNEHSNLIIAGAGSGKTSVMVARVGYIIQKYSAKPEEILLLAFNRSAAQELEERIHERLKLEGVKSSTFHALGLEIIAKSQGKKPSLSKTVEDEREFENLINSFIEDLGKTNRTFSRDMAHFLSYPFAKYRSENSFKSDIESKLYLQKNNIRTLKNEKVKSYEEVHIANFLFINQIQYQYEPYYEHATADMDYRQYQPDFYLPEYKIYIEHFGVDEEGNTAPYVDKKTYTEGMNWKRSIHNQYGTQLIETYSYETRKGGLVENLEKKLEKFGVKLRPLSVSELIRQFDDSNKKSNPIVKLFATFLNNYKSNQHSIESLIKRAGDDKRILTFLKIFQPVYEKYEHYLHSRGEVDFNDMILHASEIIKSGLFISPYRFILVDEFQDISVSRSELVKELLEQNKENVLTAVGDDWQSINRFAGSDISIFKEFENYFGESDSVALDYTFRYNDNIAEVSKKFIECNPSQITKKINTLTRASSSCVHVWWNSDKETEKIFADIIMQLAIKNTTRDFTVFILARYWFLLPTSSVIASLKRQYPQITFNLSSVHASKGLEADYVIGLGLESGKYGFPSAMEDDPIIDIVLAKQEDFEYAEERRLFYVLLTRAKEEVHLIASLHSRSAFSIELEDQQYPITHHYPNGIKPRFCPECSEGTIVTRKNSNGSFWGCSNYPACDYTEPIHKCPECSIGNLTHDVQKKLYICDNEQCIYEQKGCRLCGALMVKRQNSRTKEYFMGCSNYSKGCRYTYQL